MCLVRLKGLDKCCVWPITSEQGISLVRSRVWVTVVYSQYLLNRDKLSIH